MARVALVGANGTGRFTMVDDADLALLEPYRWLRHSDGYVVRSGGVYLHRLLLKAPRGVEVDHINGDRLDNRRVNLRLASHAENARNGRMRPVGSSGFIGVHRTKSGRWNARIRVDGERIDLGTFLTADGAAAARDEAARRLHRSFAVLNDVDASPDRLESLVPLYPFEGEYLNAAEIGRRTGVDARTVHRFVAKGCSLDRLRERLPNHRTHEDCISLVRELVMMRSGISYSEVARLARLKKARAKALLAIVTAG